MNEVSGVRSQVLGELLALSGVSAGYGKSRVIHEVSLIVGAGEIVCLLGPNGAG